VEVNFYETTTFQHADVSDIFDVLHQNEMLTRNVLIKEGCFTDTHKRERLEKVQYLPHTKSFTMYFYDI